MWFFFCKHQLRASFLYAVKVDKVTEHSSHWHKREAVLYNNSTETNARPRNPWAHGWFVSSNCNETSAQVSVTPNERTRGLILVGLPISATCAKVWDKTKMYLFVGESGPPFFNRSFKKNLGEYSMNSSGSGAPIYPIWAPRSQTTLIAGDVHNG